MAETPDKWAAAEVELDTLLKSPQAEKILSGRVVLLITQALAKLTNRMNGLEARVEQLEKTR